MTSTALHERIGGEASAELVDALHPLPSRCRRPKERKNSALFSDLRED